MVWHRHRWCCIWRPLGIRLGEDEGRRGLLWLAMVRPFGSLGQYRQLTAFRIFIIEGLATIIAAVFAKFLVVDWPAKAKFLTEEERALLFRRLDKDGGFAKMGRLDLKAVKRTFSDWKIWIG